MKRLLAVAIVVALLAASNVFAALVVPKADLKGSKDSPLSGRFQGSLIISYQYDKFDEFTAPLSMLEKVKDTRRRDNHNNHVYEPKHKQTVEGEHWRLVYLMPENVSPLEVVRNYQSEIKGKGGKVLYECGDKGCGGDPSRSSGGGGGSMSLAMYLEPEEKLNDHNNTIGYKAQTSSIGTQRYTVGVLASTGAYVSVLAYAISAGPHTREANLRGRTIAVVDIIQPKQREQKMVTIKAEEMAGRIATAGSIALYGIYFDFNKSDVKPESGQTLEQIARLMKEKPGMKLLVVGHTDNAGGFSSNMDLSQRRAVAVVNALASRYGADRKRLTPVGVSFACPIASNKSEAGRAKNRRVELVEN